jgi:hypothetical protein
MSWSSIASLNVVHRRGFLARRRGGQVIERRQVSCRGTENDNSSLLAPVGKPPSSRIPRDDHGMEGERVSSAKDTGHDPAPAR